MALLDATPSELGVVGASLVLVGILVRYVVSSQKDQTAAQTKQAEANLANAAAMTRLAEAIEGQTEHQKTRDEEATRDRRRLFALASRNAAETKVQADATDRLTKVLATQVTCRFDHHAAAAITAYVQRKPPSPEKEEKDA